MPAPLNPNLWAVVLHDTDGNPVGPDSPIPTKGQPGTTITSEPFVPVAAGATVPLPAIPSGTRSMTVQIPVGSALSNILIREVGGTPGTGRLLTYLASTLFGGADGAVQQLEAENIAGPDAEVSVIFERD
jgi:hypothetical protein